VADILGTRPPPTVHKIKINTGKKKRKGKLNDARRLSEDFPIIFAD